MQQWKDLSLEEIIKTKISAIQQRSKQREIQARACLEIKVKPLGALGILEDLATVMAGIYDTLDLDISQKANIIFCADNGVFEEGYNKYPRSISRLVTEIMARGVGGGAVIASSVGARIKIVNLGIQGNLQAKNIEHQVIRYQGTANIAKGPAMTRQEACQAILIGMQQAEELFDQGIQVITAGEIGLGNTTSSAAVIAAITGRHPEEVTGMGSGGTEEMLRQKKKTVEKALYVNKPNSTDSVDVISKVGGFDIAAITGVMLAAACQRKLMVIDGIISQAAALCAITINPGVKDYLIPSHLSGEKGAEPAFTSLGFMPSLHLGMRLGEGTGACLLFPVLDAAAAILKNMASFDDLGRWFPDDWPV